MVINNTPVNIWYLFVTDANDHRQELLGVSIFKKKEFFSVSIPFCASTSPEGFVWWYILNNLFFFYYEAEKPPLFSFSVTIRVYNEAGTAGSLQDVLASSRRFTKRLIRIPSGHRRSLKMHIYLHYYFLFAQAQAYLSVLTQYILFS